MSYFTPSNLVKGLAVFLENYKSFEWRLPDTAALSAAYTGEKASPMLKELRKREDRAVSAFLPIRKAKGSETERTHDHTGTSGDSQETPITWQQSIDTFSISLKQNDNNVISFAENYASQLQNTIFNVLIDAENKYIASLLADVTEINVGGINGTFVESNIMEIDADQSDYLFYQIKANMNQNLYKGQITCIADSIASIHAAKSTAQGAGNATNLGWQFQNMNVLQSTNTIYSGYNGSVIAFPSESAGLVGWIPKQNRKPINPQAALSYNGDWGMISVPVYDDKGNVKYVAEFAVHTYASRADASALNGNKQDLLIQVEVSWDTGYLSAPLGGFRATGDFAGKTDSVIYGYGLKTEGGA